VGAPIHGRKHAHFLASRDDQERLRQESSCDMSLARCLLCNWQRTRGRLSSTCLVNNTCPHALGQTRNYRSPASVLIPIKASPTSSNAPIGELLLDDQGHVVWTVLGLGENAEASGLRFKNTASCDEQGVQGAILCPDGFWQTAKPFCFHFPGFGIHADGGVKGVCVSIRSGPSYCLKSRGWSCQPGVHPRVGPNHRNLW